jgi:hypothetical protein
VRWYRHCCAYWVAFLVKLAAYFAAALIFISPYFYLFNPSI